MSYQFPLNPVILHLAKMTQAIRDCAIVHRMLVTSLDRPEIAAAPWHDAVYAWFDTELGKLALSRAGLPRTNDCMNALINSDKWPEAVWHTPQHQIGELFQLDLYLMTVTPRQVATPA